jgi:hypothetical protein
MPSIYPTSFWFRRFSKVPPYAFKDSIKSHIITSIFKRMSSYSFHADFLKTMPELPTKK